MRQWFAALALTALACGGGGKSAQQQAQTPATPAGGQAAAQAAAPASGTVHEVKMEVNNQGDLYDPSPLTIKVGDTVKWINYSGGPHNVAFYPDSIPAGAADALNADMPNRMAPLNGPLITDSLGVYQVTFANVPAGTYKYYCIPHEAMGMKGTLNIEK
jgi:plastocyanin